MRKIASIAGTLVVLLAAGAVSAQVVDQKGLTVEAARRVIAAATAEAHRNQVGGRVQYQRPPRAQDHVGENDLAQRTATRREMDVHDGRLDAVERA
jgi:hypothetical protein